MPPTDPDAKNQPTATAVRAELVCVAGPDRGRTFRLAPGTTLLGRDETCDVALTEVSISRQHAQIDRTGDGTWTLKNLSSNGTCLNKKPVDEAPLSDGDMIFLGAKTRLQFSVDAVAVSPGGRPQFRARTATTQKGEDETPQPAPETAPTAARFPRRKKLFVGLGIYLGGILAIVVFVLATQESDLRSRAGVPQLAPDDTIRILATVTATVGEEKIALEPPQTLRVNEKQPGGYLVENASGSKFRLSKADEAAGRIEFVQGIRNAIAELPPSENPGGGSRSVADQYVANAMDLYDRRIQSPSHLFNAIRGFQMALAELRTGYLPNLRADQAYHQAVNELTEEIQRTYEAALMEEQAGHDDKAVHLYNRILDRIPDLRNPIVKNIGARLGEMRKRNLKLK